MGQWFERWIGKAVERVSHGLFQGTITGTDKNYKSLYKDNLPQGWDSNQTFGFVLCPIRFRLQMALLQYIYVHSYTYSCIASSFPHMFYPPTLSCGLREKFLSWLEKYYLNITAGHIEFFHMLHFVHLCIWFCSCLPNNISPLQCWIWFVLNGNTQHTESITIISHQMGIIFGRMDVPFHVYSKPLSLSFNYFRVEGWDR